MEKSIIGQMQDAYRECLAKGFSAIRISGKLRRDYINELAHINGKECLLPTYNGYPLIPKDSAWWDQRQKRLKGK